MFIYAANWKMRMPFNQAISFCNGNYEDFVALAIQKDKRIVLFPEFTQIKSVYDIFKDTNVLVGAQNCSANEPGAFTGQVSVASLAQIGCDYCIIGHSEVRECVNESPEEMALKILRLFDEGISPILCVGETFQDFSTKNTEMAIKNELESVFEAIKGIYGDKKIEREICIAYEPVWAIGTGAIPEIDHIEKVFDLVLQISRKFKPVNKIRLIYGGSIDEINAKKLKNIKNLGGFLLGGVSLDFKKFKKIVEL